MGSPYWISAASARGPAALVSDRVDFPAAVIANPDDHESADKPRLDIDPLTTASLGMLNRVRHRLRHRTRLSLEKRTPGRSIAEGPGWSSGPSSRAPAVSSLLQKRHAALWPAPAAGSRSGLLRPR